MNREKNKMLVSRKKNKSGYCCIEVARQKTENALSTRRIIWKIFFGGKDRFQRKVEPDWETLAPLYGLCAKELAADEKVLLLLDSPNNPYGSKLIDKYPSLSDELRDASAYKDLFDEEAVKGWMVVPVSNLSSDLLVRAFARPDHDGVVLIPYSFHRVSSENLTLLSKKSAKIDVETFAMQCLLSSGGAPWIIWQEFYDYWPVLSVNLFLENQYNKIKLGFEEFQSQNPNYVFRFCGGAENNRG